jgi:hypothetical protein
MLLVIFHYSSNLSRFWPQIKLLLPTQELHGYLGWSLDLSDIIWNGGNPRTTAAKFGSYLFSVFRREDENVKILQTDDVRCMMAKADIDPSQVT